MVNLERLPTELILRICDELEPADVAQTAAVSRTLLAVCRSDDAWKPRARQLWDAFALDSSRHRLHAQAQLFGDDSDEPWAWWTVWRDLLGPNERYLGLWASQLPFRGRLCSCNLALAVQDVDAAPRLIDRLVVVLHYVTAHNAADAQLVDEQLPRGAQLLDALDASYILPVNHPSPERGLSVDVFTPKITLTPLLQITARHGAYILRSSQSPYGSQVCPASLPLDLDYTRSHRTQISRDLALLGQSLQDALHEDSLAGRFPTLALMQADALRMQPRFIDQETIETVAFSWMPRLSRPATPASSDLEEALPTVERPGPRIIYQNPPAAAAPRIVRPPTAIHLVRGAAGENAVPMIFHIDQGGQLLRRVPATFGGGAGSNARLANSTTSPLASGAAERFFPLKPWTNAPGLGTGHEVEPDHLRGLWAGSFGPHGIEFGFVNARHCDTVSFHADELNEEQPLPSAALADPTMQRGSSYGRRWMLQFVKLTGDVNVPSGCTSWHCFLPEVDGKPKIPTVHADDLKKWNAAHEDEQRAVGSRWEAGTLEAKGQVAFSGFVQPRLSDARITFVRSSRPDGLDVVNEIRFRWCELGKVASFRRVEPSQLQQPIF